MQSYSSLNFWGGGYESVMLRLILGQSTSSVISPFFFKGEFLSAVSPREPPFSPSLLPFESESDKMVYVWLTDYVVNTAGFVYQSAGVLNETITPSMVGFSENVNVFLPIISMKKVSNILFFQN